MPDVFFFVVLAVVEYSIEKLIVYLDLFLFVFVFMKELGGGL
jgi:hypothetical protein